jgi:hypothetical protein
MSSSVRGRGGSVTIYLKHFDQELVKRPYSNFDMDTYLQTLIELLLLLVDYAQSEVDLIGLLEIRRHSHDLREGFFGVVKRTITIIKDADPVPQLGFL